MIRGRNQLKEAFSRGETVSLQHMFEGDGWRLATTISNETVFRSALNKALEKGEAVVLATDIAGEPFEYGPPS